MKSYDIPVLIKAAHGQNVTPEIYFKNIFSSIADGICIASKYEEKLIHSINFSINGVYILELSKNIKIIYVQYKSHESILKYNQVLRIKTYKDEQITEISFIRPVIHFLNDKIKEYSTYQLLDLDDISEIYDRYDILIPSVRVQSLSSPIASPEYVYYKNVSVMF